MKNSRTHPARVRGRTADARQSWNKMFSQVFAGESLEARQLLTTFYVNTNSSAASDSNRGTSLVAPLKTITQALLLASENNATSQSDTIEILAGVYHEQPYVYAADSGTSATNRTVITAYINPATGAYEPVYIDAADPTTGSWTQDGSSNIWYLSNFTTETSGVWVDWSSSNDGAGLTQIGGYGSGFYDQRIEVGSGVSDMFAGSYFGDIADSRLYVWLADGSNPNSHVMEYANRAREIYQPGTEQGSTYTYASQVDFDGLNLRHDNVYATGGQDLGCAMYTTNDERLIGCNIQWNAGVGVYLRRTSEMIGCVGSNDGSNGIQGQGSGFLVQGGQYEYDYWRNYTDAGEAGIKVITNNPLSYGDIENAEIAYNYGKGIWFDTNFENDVVSQVSGNYIHDNQGTGIDLEASRNFLIANNVIADNQADGISLNAVENAQICNNTIVGNYGVAAIELDGGTRSQGSVYPGTIGMLNNSIENNIIANNFTVYEIDVPTIAAGSAEINHNTSDYNLFYRLGGPLHFSDGGSYVGTWGDTPSALVDWQADSGQDQHSAVADPLFLSSGTGANSYQLGSNSPAVNLGANLSAVITTDYAGDSRPASGAFDAGAFQYNGGGTGTSGAVVVNTDPTVWVDDQLPDQAAMTTPDDDGNIGENQFWLWESSNVDSGAAALDSTVMSGAHRQYFTGANPRAVCSDDSLFAYVYIDPTNLPSEIMLEWQDSSGSWDHLAYWGQNQISGAVDGSDDVQYMGPLPAAGQWTELSVPASMVGLAGANITGFSFDLYNGRALLDKIGNGTVSSGGLAGTVFQDNNSNGVQDAGEPGIAGVTVYLDLNNDGNPDPSDPTAVTGSNGEFVFPGVAPGTYTLRQVLPNGFISSNPNDSSFAVTISGSSSTLQSLGDFPTQFTSTASGNNYIVGLSADGSSVDIWDNEPESAVPTCQILQSSIRQLTISTGGYQSTVTEDFRNGSPLYSGGFTFDGGSGGGTFQVLGMPDQANSFSLIYNQIYVNGSAVTLVNPQTITIVGGSSDDVLNTVGTHNVAFDGGAGNDTLNVNPGTFTFTGDPEAETASLTVNVFSFGEVDFAAGAPGSGINTFHLAALNLGYAATARLDPSDSSADRSLLILDSLSFAGPSLTPQGLLDLSNNDLIVHNNQSSLVESEIAGAYNSGTWTGDGGITSSAAAGDTTYTTALGYMQGTTLPFDGQSVSSTDTLVKYTYYGDTNLDGQVDGSDYSRLDFAELFGSTGWENGDFNYDGMLDGSDFTLLDNAFNNQGAAIEAQIAAGIAGSIHVKPMSVAIETLPGVDSDVADILNEGSYMSIDPLIGAWTAATSLSQDVAKISSSVDSDNTNMRPVLHGKMRQNHIHMSGGGALIDADNLLGALA